MARRLQERPLLHKLRGPGAKSPCIVAICRGRDPLPARLAIGRAGGDRDALVEAKLNLGRLAIAQGHGSDALNRLRPLVGPDVTPDRNLALQCSVAFAEALIQTKDYTRARQILQDAATPSEKSGMRLGLARIYYLEATASRLSGNSGDAWNQYRQAMTLLNAVRNQPGAENILRRADLKAIFDDCSRWVGAGSKPNP